eukprot:COSAG02_NODE_1533_length_12076_cov_2.829173_8_plen_99_part_00
MWFLNGRLGFTLFLEMVVPGQHLRLPTPCLLTGQVPLHSLARSWDGVRPHKYCSQTTGKQTPLRYTMLLCHANAGVLTIQKFQCLKTRTSGLLADDLV